MLGNMADHAAISTGRAGREQLKEKGSRQSFDQEPPAVLLTSWGFMKTAIGMSARGFPSSVSAGAIYFSGIRRAARSSALWASRS
jgi:hypothetical protein